MDKQLSSHFYKSYRIFYILADIIIANTTINYMKENKLAKLSLEQLQKEKQKSKGALIGLLIVCVILITFMIVLTIKTKRFFLLASLGGGLFQLYRC